MGKCTIIFEDSDGSDGNSYTMRAEFDPPLNMKDGKPSKPTPAQMVGAQFVQVIAEAGRGEVIDGEDEDDD